MSPVPSAGFTPLSFLSTKGSSPSHDDGGSGDDDGGGGNHNKEDYDHETDKCTEQHSNRSSAFWLF